VNIENASISVVLASKGRPDAVGETIDSLQHQTLKPTQIIVVVPASEDLPVNKWGDRVQYIVGPHGLTSQRNKGIEAIPNSVTYVACFDDDFEPKADYLEKAAAFLCDNPVVIGISGRVLANGNISRERARQVVADSKPGGNPRGRFFSKGKHHILFGCNMVIRRSVLNYESFDENLPFYSYGEDYDLSIRLERYGLIGRFDGCHGVHLETPTGRVREELRGYSFVANNWYFLRKGVVHLPLAIAWTRFWLISVGQNILITSWHLMEGNQTLDWRGRLKGQLLAIKDIFLGRCHPGRIKEM